MPEKEEITPEMSEKLINEALKVAGMALMLPFLVLDLKTHIQGDIDMGEAGKFHLTFIKKSGKAVKIK